MISSTLKGLVMKKWGNPTPEDFELIRPFVSDDFKLSDLFIYPVKLCDNATDREGEYFSDLSLQQLADAFIGKPGIYDHDWHKAIQTHSRVYKTEVVEDGDYKYLLAHAYTTYDDLIRGIRSGSLKEVSVGFEPGKKTKTERGICIEDVLDAYEFSFVSVPAQPKAGVVKNKNEEDNKMAEKDFEAQLKGLNTTIDELKETISSKDSEIASLKSHIKSLKMKSGLDNLFSTLVPKNDNAEELACKVLEEKHFYDEEGNLNVDAALALLKDEYDFLFDTEVAEANKSDELVVAEPKSEGEDVTTVPSVPDDLKAEDVKTEDDLKSYVAKQYKARQSNSVVEKALGFTHTVNEPSTKSIAMRAGFKF